jgi:hypothetical protein
MLRRGVFWRVCRDFMVRQTLENELGLGYSRRSYRCP